MAELAFVMSPDQNWFFREFVAAIREELDRLGIASSLSIHGFPEPLADRIYVLVPPHEYVALEGMEALPPDELLARSIFICAEQPGTVHFGVNADLASRAGATFDINRWGVELFQHVGVPAQHLQLGHTPRWDHFDPERERDIDVLFLGCNTLRRSQYLNSYGSILSRWNCHLQISDNSAPNTGSSPGFLAEEKWDLLSRAKTLINLHQGEAPYFEWMRALDALHSGVVLVSEHSVGVAPLVPGTHLFTGRPESLALIADGLLRDEPRLERVRRDAYEFIRSSIPFAPSVEKLAEAANALAKTHFSSKVKVPAVRTSRPEPVDPVTQARPSGPPELAALRAGVKDTRLDLLEIRRQLAKLQATISSPNQKPPPRAVRVRQTRAWQARRGATVTVLTALFNHRDSVVEMLDSLAVSAYPDFEIIVVDDGSTDGSGDAVAHWMRQHEDLAALLVRHPVNLGLGAARNTALDFSRSPYCLILDSDNKLYPRCMQTLVESLDASPEVVFVYPMLEAFGMVDAYVAGGGAPLVSVIGWEPQRLRHGNFIDALSMIRADSLRELGGYATDKRLFGWEDYDLWCRVAESGGQGKLVPQILARYRTSPASMQWTTNISTTAAVSALIERHPKLMEGVMPPS
jgi:GT2 family glycosyltransferase